MYKQSSAINPTINTELTRIEEALNNPFDVHQLRELHVAPTKPQDGMLARADGENWNPGGGKGLYLRDNGSWRKVCLDCDSGTATGSGGGVNASSVDRFGIYLSSDRKVKAYVGEAGKTAVTISSDNEILNNTTYFVFVQRVSGVLKMYVNNVLQTETATSTANLTAGVPTFTLGNSYDGTLPWSGGLDDCAVLSKSLNTALLDALYSSGI